MRVNADRLQLKFEATVPLLGRQYRTKRSRAGTPPYWELVVTGEGTEARCGVVEVSGGGVTTPITDEHLKIRDAYMLLEGVELADRLSYNGREVEPA